MKDISPQEHNRLDSMLHAHSEMCEALRRLRNAKKLIEQHGTPRLIEATTDAINCTQSATERARRTLWGLNDRAFAKVK